MIRVPLRFPFIFGFISSGSITADLRSIIVNQTGAALCIEEKLTRVE